MANLKDILLDIVHHTYVLGSIDLVRITSENNETKLDTLSSDRKVIVKALFKEKIHEFSNTFGLPNLNKLNTILNIPEYKEDPIISVKSQSADDNNPVGICFENKSSDFRNEYRLMSEAVVTDQLKTIKFKGVKWNIDIKPSVASIQKLKFQSQANSEETVFLAKTEKGDLKFFFGNHSSHAGDFVFEKNVSGTLSRSWAWPVKEVLSILSLPGNKSFKISDEGAAMITVDSGIADYEYILPAQSK